MAVARPAKCFWVPDHNHLCHYQQSDLANKCMSSYPVRKSGLSVGQRVAEAQGWIVNFMGHFFFFIFVLNMHVCECTKAHIQMCEAITELCKQIYFTKMEGSVCARAAFWP